MADLDTLRDGGWTAFTDKPLRAADAITSLLDENKKLRAALQAVVEARMPGEARRIARAELGPHP